MHCTVSSRATSVKLLPLMGTQSDSTEAFPLLTFGLTMAPARRWDSTLKTSFHVGRDKGEVINAVGYAKNPRSDGISLKVGPLFDSVLDFSYSV